MLSSMDRVQPLVEKQATEAFMPEITPSKYKIAQKEIVLKVDEFNDYPIEQESSIVILTRQDGIEKTPLSKKESKSEIPKIVITRENEALQITPLPEFEYLDNASTFHLVFTGKTSCKVINSSGLTIFKGSYPKSKCFEGWHSEPLEKFVDIIEFQNSELVMQLRFTVPSCQACFEEETTNIDIIDANGMLIATITQKKTWMNTNIAREVIIRPGPLGTGKIETYKAEFSWNDLSVNFKASSRSGLVVANLLKEYPDSKKTSDFTLQILRDTRTTDKAVLIAFMLARDLLMIDEKQTRQIVERVTAFIVLLFLVVIIMYFFI